MTQAEPPVLDREGTLERLKGDKDFLHALFTVFLDDLPAKLATLEDAVEQRSMDDMLRTAHSIKGAAATIGAMAARKAALDVEMAARKGEMDKALDLVPQLKTSLDALARRLRSETA